MYYLIKPKSEIYQNIKKRWEENDKWYNEEIGKVIEEFINLPKENMYCVTYGLALKNPIPGRENEFKKPNKGVYWAKKNSKAEKQWFEIVKEYNLSYESAHREFDNYVDFDTRYDTGTGTGGRKSSWKLQRVNDKLILEANSNNLHEKFDFFEQLEEGKYHQLMADYYKDKQAS